MEARIRDAIRLLNKTELLASLCLEMFVALEKSVDLGTDMYQVKKAECKENWLNLS